MTTKGLSVPGISVGGPGAGATDRTRQARTPTPAGRPWRRFAPRLGVDLAAIVLAALDVWLVFPDEAPAYSLPLSAAACLALAARHWLPFAAMLATVPGFLAGWAQLAAMIALGTLALRKQLHWQTWVGAGLIFLCRFVEWPLTEFAELDWREHVLNGIYGVLVAGMPVAIGLLIALRSELSARLRELAASRDRERRLHDQAVRAEERARLAREMHDLVSHNITLVAMHAGALSVVNTGPHAQQTAQTIRELSTHTLEELRSLVGMLRTGTDHDSPQPHLSQLDHLVRTADVPVQLTMGTLPDHLPENISGAAYRTVQESLTNVQKHAPGAKALVLVAVRDDQLHVEVCNEPPGQPSTTLPSGGHGLTGLAERARLLGGTFTAAATDAGGFRVCARYPFDDSDTAGALDTAGDSTETDIATDARFPSITIDRHHVDVT